ncbi:uncharacterized protein MELLADRAFT_63864 [Melampsora larici-populina 98AG31]|uniref:Uncharacterized protein n=1 Tax=Melampsora larici-populina (strain 98AG31 / pathotype 3-4-7) TaxID=747676 RepID=F4RPE7_MELLP|nr:uncharacterized protein MELLADRAFT_63864 [Melampsora larici-populina 98AG31]EGG05858.1 hypothetical protein MELLADRAFT_63864 [Melampsora larici-populina 98AG31]
MSSQLCSLNNHSLLRRNASRLPGMSSRVRDGRSSSPSNRGPSSRRSPSPSGDDLGRELGSPTASTPANQVPATAFTLSSARRTLAGGEKAFFETMSMNAGLDPVHHEYAQYLAEVNGLAAQHIAQSVAQAKTLFNIDKLSDAVGRMAEKLEEVSSMLENHLSAESQSNGPSANAVAWVCSPELHSYTALEANRVWLSHSFFSSIRTRLNAQPNEWKQQHLPGGSLGIQDSVGTRLLTTHIRNVCKHTREKLHILLLTGIYDPKTGAVMDDPVPNLKLLWHRIANRMGVAGSHADANSLWANTDAPTRARIAYLVSDSKKSPCLKQLSHSNFLLFVPLLHQRREAVHIFQNGRGSGSVWASVDKKLASLRAKGDDYTIAFYKVVYNQDREAFNFKNLFDELKETCDFALPTDEVVEDAIGAEQSNQDDE